ncbi:MAG: ATP-dependent helicase [Candidatus Gastranaerophilales bacterium]|nr:ATP-dependent helicase [Candidatus Gastranaerophilales bacterium]
MLIEGNLKSNKTDLLIEKYVELINQGVRADSILVLCLNPFKKQAFINSVKEKIFKTILPNPKIYTFYGLSYNAFSDNWVEIENLINLGKTTIQPNLCSLEVSQYIFKQSIKTAGFQDYMSKINLLHQLFKRYSLIVQNALSKEQVEARSGLLNESFFEDSYKAIENYKKTTLEKRSFDYLRQLSIFEYIYTHTDYFKDIKHLIVDDADEITYINWQFLKHLKPQLESATIAYDKNGASRCGYLSAYKTGVYEFETVFEEKAKHLKTEDIISQEADLVFDAIKKGEQHSSDIIKIKSYTKRLDLFDSLKKMIAGLFEKEAKPSEISIVTPNIDEVLKFSIAEIANELDIEFQFLSGNEKLFENSGIKNALALLKLTNPDWNLKIEPIEIRVLFTDILKIPLKYCYKIFHDFKENNQLIYFEFENSNFTQKYQDFLNISNELKQTKNSLSEKLLNIYEKILSEKLSPDDTNKFSFLLKEVESFEKAFGTENAKAQKNFAIQLENSIISENPAVGDDIKENCILVGSPQKIIDSEIKTKYQFWLDISSPNWQKQDIGTLYNAWVFNADWDKKEFNYEDNLTLSREKTARTLRKLMLCSEKNIYAFASLYDNLGNENFGGILDFFKENNIKKQQPQRAFTPRSDQAPVLDYKKGQMGIMAVPGAGKTTILLALILKLMNMGTKAENIFVLTYMDAAAKNFKERIKAANPDSHELPNISTIHGLALRIIKENSNYAKVNLNENFEICDDIQKQKIITNAIFNLKLDAENAEKYQSAISAIKLSSDNFNLESEYKEIKNFVKFFNEYNKLLRENNLIDYDDMLDLAVKILEKNQDILDYYQNLCEFIIEDEAQDSSSLQQKLLKMLSAKHKNLIRCGDVNQAITATFTNSDLKNFKDFLHNSNCVEMDSSQRCSEPVYSLANKILKTYSKTLPNAFYDIEMKSTNKNPSPENGIVANIFANEKEEHNYIIKTIKNIFSINPNASIALLLRNNYQVNNYNKILQETGFHTITRNDSLGEKNIFKIIFSIINIAFEPWNNKHIIEFSTALNKIQKIELTASQQTYLKDLKRPFITTDLAEIKANGLIQLYTDTVYWIENSYLDFDTLAVKAGLYYFSTPIEKSNVYLVAMIIKRLSAEYKKPETIIEKLIAIAKRPNLPNYKFFNSENENNEIQQGSVQIMTMHKSKGDEFDYVFIPELIEENYATNINNLNIKSNSHFIETIKKLNPNYKQKNIDELKQEQVEETLRLLYVGITRAKKDLYLSCAKAYIKRKKPTISTLFKIISEDNYVE